MSGRIEWVKVETKERTTAEVVKCVMCNDKLNIVFANKRDESQGRISFKNLNGMQSTQALFTTPSYQGTAEVVGLYCSTSPGYEFFGSWYDESDGTGAWTIYIEIDEVSEHILTYEDS